MCDDVLGAVSRRMVLALGGAVGLAGAVPAMARAAPPPIPQDQAGLRAWYDRYIDAFNRGDFDTFSPYYADDILFEGRRGSVRGLAAVLDDFRMLMRREQQTATVLGFVGSVDRISVEFHTIRIGLEDNPDLENGGLKKGERRDSINFAIYELKDGRFMRARSALFRLLPATAASSGAPAPPDSS